MDPLKYLPELDSPDPNSRAWGGQMGPFWVALDYQQNPAGRRCWSAQCYDSSWTQLACSTGDTPKEVFDYMLQDVRESLREMAERLFKKQEEFEAIVKGAMRLPSFFERLNDECFGPR